MAAFFAAGLIYSVLPMTGFIIFGEYTSALLAGLVALVCGIVTVKMVQRLTR